MPAEPALRCVALSVDYPGTRALDAVDLVVERGELIGLLGASGSGKSTLLHAIAGLVTTSSGEIWLAGRKVADGGRGTSPERRDVGLVFQDFALWPHLSCLETVAYPMRRAGVRAGEARARAQELLDQLGIGQLAARRPAELSGGQQQRVGLARALAREPQLFLLDEPTAHLDTHLRTAFQDSVRERRANTGAAAIYATHDASEALALADRVALIVAGRIVQVGTPEAVYAEPADVACAQLTGAGSVVRANLARIDGGQLRVDLGEGVLQIPGGGAVDATGGRGRLLVRPEWVHLDGPLRGRVVDRAFRGPHTDYRIDTSLGVLPMRLAGGPGLEVGAAVGWGLSRGWVLPDDPTGTGRSADGVDRARMLDPAVDHVEV